MIIVVEQMGRKTFWLCILSVCFMFVGHLGKKLGF